MNLKTLFSRGLLALVVLLAAFGALPSAAQSSTGKETASLLRFTADGHVLGFASDQVVLAGVDHALTVKFLNGSGSMPVVTEAGSGGEGNVPALGRVLYPQVWRGVDVAYSAIQSGVAESSYLLAPGARVENIRLQYNAPLTLLADGRLSFSFESGEMIENAPLAWQDINGKRVPVKVGFEKLGPSEAGFALGGYDPAYGLTIDPGYSWHTFYGSSGIDRTVDLVVDAGGNILVTGYSAASWNGPGNISPLHAHSGGNDIFVLKLNSQGAYQWHTFYGSTSSDQAASLALDGKSNVYVTGISGNSWNGSAGEAPLHSNSGGGDVFVLKLDGSGSYLWHTFFGSANFDLGQGITSYLSNIFNGTSTIYVVGRSSVSWTGPGAAAPLHPFAGAAGDFFVLKLSETGSYSWHTFYGASQMDDGLGIVASNSGVYMTGYSLGAWDGDGNVPPLHAYSSSTDLVVLKLSHTGAYQWHTFYGSTAVDEAHDIAMDSTGNLYITGRSNMSWDGPNGQLPIHAHNQDYDMVVLKLNTSGAYQWHTFYGTGGNGLPGNIDEGNHIAVTSSGVYLSGTSIGSWNGDGDTQPFNPFTGTGNDNIFVAKLTPDGIYEWHSFYGSAADETGDGIGVDKTGGTYIGGTGTATWDGPGNIPPLNAFSNNYEILVIKQPDLSAKAMTAFSFASPAVNGSVNEAAHTIAVTVPFGTNPNGLVASFTKTGASVTVAGTPQVSGTTANNFTAPLTYRVTAVDSSFQDYVVTVTITAGSGPTFVDVPASYWAYSFIESLYSAGVTGGCVPSPLSYCPDNSVTRAQMAVFLLKGIHGSSYTPPAINGNTGFGDVAVDHWAAAWIKQLSAEGITSGCGAGVYCPEATVTRAQMAVFLLKAKHGASYVPSNATGVFTDVPVGYWADKWIEQLAAEGVTSGCGNGNYCPDAEVTRAQMAVFLVKAFNLP